MNKNRRAKLSEASGFLGQALSIVESVKDEEQDSLDNLPENLQESERAETMGNVVQELEEAIDLINDATEHIDQATNG